MQALRVKLRYLPPNAITAASLLLGLASVMHASTGDFRLAAWMVLWGVLLDKLDGLTARLLKATSSFGVQFDSFADFVVFGIAPAALLSFKLASVGSSTTLVLAAGGVYVVCTGARLARFNVSTPPLGDRIFYGIPTTVVGALIASAYLTWDKYGLDPAWLAASPHVLFAGGALMVSTIKLPKLQLRRILVVDAFQVVNIAAVYTCGPLRIFPEYLFGVAVLYVVLGVGYYALRPPRVEASAPEAEGAPESAVRRASVPEELRRAS
jgi:CDP-diacylglycerol---serine O-phosphatidyltransferase